MRWICGGTRSPVPLAPGELSSPHVALPPSSVMKSRRLKGSNCIRFIGALGIIAPQEGGFYAALLMADSAKLSIEALKPDKLRVGGYQGWDHTKTVLPRQGLVPHVYDTDDS